MVVVVVAIVFVVEVVVVQMGKSPKKPSVRQLQGKLHAQHVRKTSIHVKGKKKTGVYRSNPRSLTHRAPRLRKGITPGTILILLSGPFRGRRVIFLGQFPKTGLLLVTGPFMINGVPLRRLNQRYVIATSKTVDLGKAGVDFVALEKLLAEEPFGRSKKEKNRERKDRLKSAKQNQFFVQNEESRKIPLPEEVKARQDTIDKPLLGLLGKDKLVAQYLKTRFTLRSNMAPHRMLF